MPLRIRPLQGKLHPPGPHLPQALCLPRLQPLEDQFLGRGQAQEGLVQGGELLCRPIEAGKDGDDEEEEHHDHQDQNPHHKRGIEQGGAHLFPQVVASVQVLGDAPQDHLQGPAHLRRRHQGPDQGREDLEVVVHGLGKPFPTFHPFPHPPGRLLKEGMAAFQA